jgi:sigma-B regulation protein RsbU (phosphoserine phosphatase)
MFDTDGLPLGIDINASYGHKMIQVKKGDYLILFTDGLPEARNPQGEEMGMPKLLRFIAKNSEIEPRKLTVKVKKFLDHYISTAKQHDDETFLALKVM